MAAAPAKPPEEVPAEFKEDVAKLQKPLAAILVGKAHRDTSRWKTWRWNTPAAARDIPGWREWVQRPDLGLHGDAPPSGSSGGSQLGPGGNQGDHPAGQAGPTKAPLEVLCDGTCLRGHAWDPEAEVGVSR